MEEADYVVDNLVKIVAMLRDMSPLYDDFIHENQDCGKRIACPACRVD